MAVFAMQFYLNRVGCSQHQVQYNGVNLSFMNLQHLAERQQDVGDDTYLLHTAERCMNVYIICHIIVPHFTYILRMSSLKCLLVIRALCFTFVSCSATCLSIQSVRNWYKYNFKLKRLQFSWKKLYLTAFDEHTTLKY